MEPLAGKWDLSWHPRARHVREDELGLTPARLRGIKESKGDLLVFVDDDNVLQADYLKACLEISEDWPRLGVWGGQHFPEFEGGATLEKWQADFWASTLSRDLWSNNYDRQATPAGAGVCVRRQVADQYAALARTHPMRLALDRKGSNLISAGDIDMAFVACDLGLGMGRFAHLKLDHLIPAHRVSDDYLIRLCEGFGYSEAVLSSLRGPIPSEKCRVDRLVDFYKRLRLPRMRRLLDTAFDAGKRRAIHELRNLPPKERDFR
jgi:glycosyltransferase involved in cell wall biosynthesis